MEFFFKWIATLSQTEQIGYASAVLFIMFFIPFAPVFFKACKKIVLWKKMSVSVFNYKLNSSSNDIEKNNIDFVIEGSKITLYWEIEGAISIKLYPKIGKVSVNAASVIVTKENRHFILEARGIFSKKQLSLEIPHDKIKSLETKELSDAEVYTRVKNIKSFPYTESKTLNNQFTKSFSLNKPLTKLRMHFTSDLNYKLSDKLNYRKHQVKKDVEEQSLLKIYNFSTKKYNKINHQKPINFKEL
jgi:hypothetical protein